MDFLRFSSSERYTSEVPLSKLSFEVTVERASVVEEEAKEVLCKVVVPWDGKEYSPQERIDMFVKVSAAIQDFSATRGEALLSNSGGAASHVMLEDSRANGSRATLENTVSRLMSSTSALAPAVDVHQGTSEAAEAAGAVVLPTERALVERLKDPQSCFFTRPTSEDYIDHTEEDIPVDPPQPFSRLAPLVLRAHRKSHKPNQNMYLMWATGHVSHRAYTVTTPATGGGLSVTDGGGGGGGAAVAVEGQGHGALHASEVGVGQPSPTASTSGKTDECLRWVGNERVMCTLTSERDTHYFTAKPSLFEDHTLMVDSTHIYTFRVVPRLTDAVRRSNATSTPPVAKYTKAGHTPPAPAPLDIRRSRQLSLEVEEGVRRLQRQQVTDRSNAQQLLETALRHLPESGLSATVTGLASQHLAPPSLPLSSPRAMLPHTATPQPTDAMKASKGLLSELWVPPRAVKYLVFGTIERTLHIPHDTIYVHCVLRPEPLYGDQFDRGGSGSSDVLFLSGRGSTAADLNGDCEFRSQMAHAGRVMYDECLCAVDHVLNLPFQCTYTDHPVPATPLRMSLTVFTEGTGATGHQAPIAYTQTTLPVATPGRHVIEAPLWAPHKTGKEFLKSALVGGAPSLVDNSYLGPAVKGTGIGVRQGMVTDNVGLVRIVVNVLHQTCCVEKETS